MEGERKEAGDDDDHGGKRKNGDVTWSKSFTRERGHHRGEKWEVTTVSGYVAAVLVEKGGRRGGEQCGGARLRDQSEGARDRNRESTCP
ncbi:hypothetical protein E2562_038433 [Oryza meyeriana var. granulata]|uniref:Uncharacterized protein n=1 Tax=Oryza meyeriana var. granulata TaxID=110450 RepID=A0A6G1E8E4_9ORYZ|nr:hypothetical protein E2562_038433 [Oryza meyeriana var. granulata]